MGKHPMNGAIAGSLWYTLNFDGYINIDTRRHILMTGKIKSPRSQTLYTHISRPISQGTWNWTRCYPITGAKYAGVNSLNNFWSTAYLKRLIMLVSVQSPFPFNCGSNFKAAFELTVEFDIGSLQFFFFGITMSNLILCYNMSVAHYVLVWYLRHW